MRTLFIISLLIMSFHFSSFSQKKCSDQIQTAIENGDLSLVEKLIEDGENIDCIGEWEQTLLMKAIQAGKEGIALYLINKNADIKEVDEDNSNALFKTGFHGLTEVARTLIEKGAKVNEKGYNGMNVLMMAANRNHLKLVELLVENGAKINAQCDSGYTALTYTSSPNILTFLLSVNADPNLKNFQGLNAIAQFKAGLEDIKGYGTPESIRNYEEIISILEKQSVRH